MIFKIGYKYIRTDVIHYSSKTIFLVIFLIPFIQSRTYSEMPYIIGNFYKYSSVLASSFIYFEVIYSKCRGIKNKGIVLYMLFWMIYLLSTLCFFPTGILYTFYQAYVHFAMVLLITKEVQRDFGNLLFSLSLIYFMLTIANYVLMIWYPNGLYETSSYHTGLLLGDDNAVAYVVLPGLVILSMYSLFVYKKIKWFVVVDAIVCELTFFDCWSANAMVCCTLFLFFFLLAMRNINFAPFFYLVAFILIVMLLLFGTSINSVSNFITETLGKDITFSGRTILWENAIRMFFNSPILGDSVK